MSDALPLDDRYLNLIDEIVQTTLKGKIRSKEQVYQRLVDEVSPGTGEMFARCLSDRLSATQAELDADSSEMRQAKLGRILRAMQTIRGEWDRWQARDRQTDGIAATVRLITDAAPDARLLEFIRALDPNRTECLGLDQVKQLSLFLRQQSQWTADRDLRQDMQQLAEGIDRGVASWLPLQDNLVSWVYESRQTLGIGTADASNPWYVWAQYLTTPFLQDLFEQVYSNQPIRELPPRLTQFGLADWVEMVIVLQYLQQGAIGWFERLVYSARLEQQLAVSTFVLFAIIWLQLAEGFEQSAGLTAADQARFADGSFHMGLQTLRLFAQRSYFPLYGGGFTSFTTARLRSVVDYFSEALKTTPATSEKARILTLIGDAERSHGQRARAQEFHEVAQELAVEQGDRRCEIANLNHLSRLNVGQAVYAEAIPQAQKALILSRQEGDRWGQANALVNLGRSEVLQAQQREQGDLTAYEGAIAYLLQGIAIAVDLVDSASLALGYNSLGIAYVLTEQPTAAMAALNAGLNIANTGDSFYLRGSDLLYLGEACYRAQDLEQAVYLATIALYYLDSVESTEWRQAAGLLVVLHGKIGDRLPAVMAEFRMKIVAMIGEEGLNHIPVLLERYRHPDA
jgi:tetratricopeptide (TPR) repeat protein